MLAALEVMRQLLADDIGTEVFVGAGHGGIIVV